MDGGGIPGGLKTLQIQSLTQHSNRLVGGSHHGPAEAKRLHLSQQMYGQEGLATAGKTTQNERGTVR